MAMSEVEMTAILQHKFQKRLEKAIQIIDDYNITRSEMGIFGSYARNEYKGTSDIDICIIVKNKPSRGVSGSLREECELIGVDITFITEDYFNNSQDRFAKKLRKDYKKI